MVREWGQDEGRRHEQEKEKFNRQIRLSPRLRAVADQVNGRVVADVGCDHGLLSAYLLQANKARQVLAIDCSAPSLLKAQRLAEALGLTERLQTFLGEGLFPVEQPIDCAVLAGFSGMQMAKVLEQGKERISEDCLVVLQPMQGRDTLARYLLCNGFQIKAENLVQEGRRFFDILVAQKGTEQNYPIRYACVGYRLMQQKHPLLKKRLQDKAAELRAIVQAAPQKVCPALLEKLECFEEVLRCL